MRLDENTMKNTGLNNTHNISLSDKVDGAPFLVANFGTDLNLLLPVTLVCSGLLREETVGFSQNMKPLDPGLQLSRHKKK